LLASAPVRAERVYVEVDAPRSGDTVRAPLPLVEVRGWAGTGLRGQHDVVIVVDRSASTFRASGVDVDGDGVVGRNLRSEGEAHAVLWTTDFGDTIVSAELLAARRLIERLDPSTTRMGLISFGANAHLEAPLGSSREQLLAALDAIPPEPRGGTYMYGALDEAINTFGAAPVAPGERRRRQILLLSDGVSTAPGPASAAQATAVRAARNAARANARISAFALGPAAASGRELFEEITSANGGDLVVLDSPADILEFVPYMSWTSVASVALENATTRERGRAVRLFPDGSFDGFAPLALGRNELRLTVTSQGGASATVTRWLTFEKGQPDPEALARFKKLLEVRALETELAERARVRREQILKKQLEIRPER
jgi:uncharacterized protein YegL